MCSLSNYACLLSLVSCLVMSCVYCSSINPILPISLVCPQKNDDKHRSKIHLYSIVCELCHPSFFFYQPYRKNVCDCTIQVYEMKWNFATNGNLIFNDE